MSENELEDECEECIELLYALKLMLKNLTSVQRKLAEGYITTFINEQSLCSFLIQNEQCVVLELHGLGPALRKLCEHISSQH